MTWPSSSVRTKDWLNEILTDSDLEGQFDLLHTYINDFLKGVTGHAHTGADGDGQKITLTTGVTGILPAVNGGTGMATGFRNGSPIGHIIFWPVVTPPTDYLVCDGSAINRTTYANLFAVLGTVFGAGDTSTTFNLPDMRGRVPVGYDSTQTEFDTIGESGGEKTHVLTTAEMPAHTHVENVNSGVSGSQIQPEQTGAASAGSIASNAITGSTGGDAAHNNLQPYIAMNFCIRYQ